MYHYPERIVSSRLEEAAIWQGRNLAEGQDQELAISKSLNHNIVPSTNILWASPFYLNEYMDQNFKPADFTSQNYEWPQEQQSSGIK